MTYKEYCEDKNIIYKTVALIDGEEVATITGASYEDTGEQWRKLDHAINEHLTAEFEDLPDATIDSPEWLEELVR